MAWETVSFKCGHESSIQFYGKHSDRENKKAWMERGVCSDCYRAQKQAERELATEAAKTEATKTGLPELIGSQKQIDWAITIRKNALLAPGNTLAAECPTPELSPVFAAAKTARTRLETETSVKWWIENRETVNQYCMDCARVVAAQLGIK